MALSQYTADAAWELAHLLHPDRVPASPWRAPVTRERSRLVIPVLVVALSFALLLATAKGSVPLPFRGVLGRAPREARAAGRRVGARRDRRATILFTVRLPRVLLAALVGGGLAVVGTVLQAVFRNPLRRRGTPRCRLRARRSAPCSPCTSASRATVFALPLAAFAGAMTAVLAVYFIAGASGRSGLHGLVAHRHRGLGARRRDDVGDAGGDGRVPRQDGAVLGWLAASRAAAGRTCRRAPRSSSRAPRRSCCSRGPLDVLSLGEEEAASLGLPVRATRLGLLGLASRWWREPARRWRAPSRSSG